jgi:hypothetical protein
MAGAAKVYMNDLSAERISLCRKVEPAIIAAPPADAQVLALEVVPGLRARHECRDGSRARLGVYLKVNFNNLLTNGHCGFTVADNAIKETTHFMTLRWQRERRGVHSNSKLAHTREGPNES